MIYASAFYYLSFGKKLKGRAMTKERYFELDWLRVMLILAVFMHHVFMPFNGDDWHIMNQESSKFLDNTMVYFEQLRLQSLFFIAGAGSLLLLTKLSGKAFMLNKFHRLLVPLIIGMLLIVPPQHYYEHIQDYPNLWSAYQERALAFSPNHLWFIEFLLVFMMLAIPLKRLIYSKSGQHVNTRLEQLVSHKHGLFSLVVVIVGCRFALKTFFPSQETHLANPSVSLFYLLFFIFGMLFISSPKVWQALRDNRRTNLYWFVICSLLFYAWFNKPDISPYVSLEMRWQMYWAVCSLVSWSGLLTMLGYAGQYCTTTPNWLRSANELIYPFYILHQTIIVAFAYYIVQWNASIAIKSASLLVSSFLVCSFCCLLVIRPFNGLRYAFGLKKKTTAIQQSL